MNSNTHIRALNNSTLFTSPLTFYTHIIPHITNHIYNPTIAVFERLIPHYEKFFFYLLNQQQTHSSELLTSVVVVSLGCFITDKGSLRF